MKIDKSHERAVPGMQARLIQPLDVLTLAVAVGSAVLKSGDIAVRTTDGTGVTSVVDGTNPRFVLIPFSNISKTGSDSDGNEAYKPGDNAPAVVEGSFYVKTGAPVTSINAAVYVRTASPTTGAPLGSLSSSSTNSTAFTGAKWESVTGSDGLAKVRLTGA